MKEKMKEIFIRSSDPYERGLQHGSQVKDRIERICAGYAKTFEKKGYTWDEAKAMAMEYVEFLDKEMPDLMMEVRGIADGSGQELAVIMLLNARYELLKFKKGVDYFENNECTCYGITPEATAEHETISGQNWDKAEYVGKELYVVHIDEENGTRIMGVSEPGQLIRNGMNSHGLCLSCSTLLSTKDFRKVAIPTNFMRRRILQCKTLEEACAILDVFEPGVSLNYVLASKTGDVVVYETTPVEHYKMYPSRGIVTQGNDIVANPVIDRFTPADKDHIHHFRGQRLNELLKMKQGEITTDYIQECLKDHYGYPGSICNHSTDKNLVTIASTMYCLNRGYGLICWGNPCEGEYYKFDV